MQWRRASEIVGGLILLEIVSADAIDQSILDTPYDQVVAMKKDGKREVDMLDRGVGLHAIQLAKDAAKSIEGDPYQYIELCEIAARRVWAAKRMAPVVSALERGEDADLGRVIEAIGQLEDGYRQWTTADNVEPEKMIYVPSYYPPLDTYVGGYPAAGLTIIAGITGTGKTTFLIELARRCIRHRKRCAILTLEMTMSQLMYRTLEVDPEITSNHLKYLHLSDDVYNIDEAYAAAVRLASQHKLHFIGIDYADMLVGRGEQSESVMGRIYNSLAVLAKKIRIPIILIAQYRRTDGKIPTINDIRYSGRAEQAASMILLLYNQDLVWSRSTMDDEVIPYEEGFAHIVIGKTRYKGNQPSSIGAIAVRWDKEHGRWGGTVGRYPDGWRYLDGRL